MLIQGDITKMQGNVEDPLRGNDAPPSYDEIAYSWAFQEYSGATVPSAPPPE